MVLRAVAAVANGMSVTIVCLNSVQREHIRNMLRRADIGKAVERITILPFELTDPDKLAHGLARPTKPRVFIDHALTSRDRSFVQRRAINEIMVALFEAGMLDATDPDDY